MKKKGLGAAAARGKFIFLCENDHLHLSCVHLFQVFHREYFSIQYQMNPSTQIRFDQFHSFFKFGFVYQVSQIGKLMSQTSHISQTGLGIE
jgi:hypothetical protein